MKTKMVILFTLIGFIFGFAGGVIHIKSKPEKYVSFHELRVKLNDLNLEGDYYINLKDGNVYSLEKYQKNKGELIQIKVIK